MLKQLIPEDIYLIRSGQNLFSGSLLFADITGFTDLSEKLSCQGKAGTEELTDLLNSYFDRILGIVQEHSGVVLGFAGDSVTVRFSSPEVASSCASALMSGLEDFSAVSTSVGSLSVGAKIVIGKGQWQEFFVGDTRRADLVLAGELISLVALAEQSASMDETAVVDGPSSVSPIECIRLVVPDSAFMVGGSEKIQGEHRAVSALFLDVTRDEGSSASFLVLQDLYLAVLDIVNAQGGVIHTLDSIHPYGCRILALFGAPVSHWDDARRAVLAGMAIRDRLGEFPAVRVRCATGLGYVYAGTIGNDWRKQYTVIGDMVNTVARLSASAPAGSLVVSRDIERATRDQVDYSEMEAVRVKGKAEALRRFEPVSVRSVRSFRFGFVGRERELASLSGVLEGRGFALITGDAGSGKTRLLDEFSSRAGESGYCVLRGVSAELGQAYPLFGSMVAGLADIDPVETPLVKRLKLSAYLESLSAPEELLRREVFLGRMLFSIDYPPSLYDDMAPMLRKENLLEALRLLICAQPEPVCLVLEDIHMSRSEELDALVSVARMLLVNPSIAVSMVVSRRPDEREFSLGEGLVPVEMTLGGLDASASASLVGEILAGKELAPDVAALVADKAEGNPFYLVQFILYLMEKELISEGEKEWVKTDSFQDDALPENVFSMIMARIDRLEEQAKESLRVASVVGSEFTEEVVRRVLDRDVLADLDMSTAAGLIYLASVSELEYIFSHLLIKDVAYDSILRRRRRVLHGDVGRILEEIASAMESDMSPVLAYHFREAQEWASALLYTMQSGKRAKDEYRNEEATEIFSDAVSIILAHLPDRLDELRECYSTLGKLFDTTGEYDSAIESYRKHLELTDDTLRRATTLEDVAGIHFTRGELDVAETLVREIEDSLVEGESVYDPIRARINNFRAWSFGVQGKLDQAKDAASKGLAIAEGLSRDEPMNMKTLGHTYNTVATVHYASSEYEDALAYYTKALEIARELKGTREVAVTMGNIGLVYNCMGRPREAVSAIEHQMEISQEQGDRLIVASSHGELASAYAPLGEYDKALYHAQSYLDISQELASAHDILIALGYLAKISLAQKRLDDAMSYAEKAIGMARNSDYEREARIGLHILGKVWRDKGDLDRASEYLLEGIEVCRKIGDREILPPILRTLAEVEITRGNLDTASGHLDEAMTLAEETGSKFSKAWVLTGISLLHENRGELPQALENIEQAVALFEETGLRPDLALACRAQGRILRGMGRRDEEADALISRAEELEHEMNIGGDV